MTHAERERIRKGAAALDDAAHAYQRGDVGECRRLLTAEWRRIWTKWTPPDDLANRRRRGLEMLDGDVGDVVSEGVQLDAAPSTSSGDTTSAPTAHMTPKEARDAAAAALLDNAGVAYNAGRYGECRRLLVIEWAKLPRVKEIAAALAERRARGLRMLDALDVDSDGDVDDDDDGAGTPAPAPTLSDGDIDALLDAAAPMTPLLLDVADVTVSGPPAPPPVVSEIAARPRPPARLWAPSAERPEIDMTCPICDRTAATVTGHIGAYPECGRRAAAQGYVTTGGSIGSDYPLKWHVQLDDGATPPPSAPTSPTPMSPSSGATAQGRMI